MNVVFGSICLVAALLFSIVIASDHGDCTVPSIAMESLSDSSPSPVRSTTAGDVSFEAEAKMGKKRFKKSGLVLSDLSSDEDKVVLAKSEETSPRGRDHAESGLASKSQRHKKAEQSRKSPQAKSPLSPAIDRLRKHEDLPKDDKYPFNHPRVRHTSHQISKHK